MGDDPDPDSQNVIWHLLTRHYPPDKSGVAAYTHNLYDGLRHQGYRTAVWDLGDPGQTRWLGADGAINGDLDRQIDGSAGRHRIFLQYEPSWQQIPGVAAWLEERRRQGNEVWIMVHQPHARGAKPLSLSRWWEKRRLGQLLKQADRVWTATGYWQPMLQRLLPSRLAGTDWLPVASNVDWCEDQQRAINLRRAFAAEAAVVLGTFGSYTDPGLCRSLKRTLPRLLTGHPDRVWLGLGRGCEAFAESLIGDHPDLEQQIQAAGELDVAALSAHIQSCDLMLQPYPQGVDTSRTSVMVGLSHRRPIVTTTGVRTEPLWRQVDAARLMPAGDVAAIVAGCEDLIKDQLGRQALGRRAREVYDQYFSMACCLRRLGAEGHGDSLPPVFAARGV